MFADDMARILVKVDKRAKRLFENSLDHVYRSITVGSHVTGAPGQPVRSGRLIKSFKKKGINQYASQVVSNVPYAIIIEDNLRGAQLRSKVGGFHSIKLTRLGWQKIVNHEMRKLRNYG